MTRYDGVVLGSGDGIFVDAVLGLRKGGLDVTVVAPPEALSRHLRMVANRIVAFADLPPEGPTAGAIAALGFGSENELGRAA